LKIEVEIHQEYDIVSRKNTELHLTTFYAFIQRASTPAMVIHHINCRRIGVTVA